jgi:hypothetical protein
MIAWRPKMRLSVSCGGGHAWPAMASSPILDRNNQQNDADERHLKMQGIQVSDQHSCATARNLSTLIHSSW